MDGDAKMKEKTGQQRIDEFRRAGKDDGVELFSKKHIDMLKKDDCIIDVVYVSYPIVKVSNNCLEMKYAENKNK